MKVEIGVERSDRTRAEAPGAHTPHEGVSMSPADTAPASVPRSPDEIARVATARGIVIPSACAQGVADNLALLERHVARMRGGEGAVA